MALANIDYEKVDMRLLTVLQMITSLEQMVSAADISAISGTSDFIIAADNYRNAVALAIETQGKR
jgi:hypothetical protein